MNDLDDLELYFAGEGDQGLMKHGWAENGNGGEDCNGLNADTRRTEGSSLLPLELAGRTA